MEICVIPFPRQVMRILAPVSGVLLVSAASGQGSALRVPTGLEIILLQYLFSTQPTLRRPWRLTTRLTRMQVRRDSSSRHSTRLQTKTPLGNSCLSIRCPSAVVHHRCWVGLWRVTKSVRTFSTTCTQE